MRRIINHLPKARLTAPLVSLIIGCLLSVAILVTSTNASVSAATAEAPDSETSPKYRKYSSRKPKNETPTYRIFEIAAFDDSVRITLFGPKGQAVEKQTTALVEELGLEFSGITFENNELSVHGQTIAADNITKVADSVYRHPTLPGVDILSITFWSSETANHAQRLSGNKILVGKSYSLPEKKFVRGSVICFGGDVTISGEVNHSVITVGGDITALPSAVIRDHAISLGGIVRNSEGSHIYGHIILDVSGKRPNLRNRPWQSEQQTLSFSPSFTYDRVDGFTPFVGWGFEDKDSSLPNLRLRYGLATTSDRQRFQFTIDQPIYKRGQVSLLGSMYKKLKSDQDYLLPEWQNSLVALVARTDYKNYYEAEGVELGVSLRLSKDNQISLGFLTETLLTLPATTELWSLFGGEEPFPENYQGLSPALQSGAIAEFNDRRYSALFLRGTASNESKHTTASSHTTWKANGSLERSLPDLDSDFSFTRIQLQGSLTHPVTRHSEFQTMALWGASSDSLPLYRSFYTGGYRWLRGYERLELVGKSFWALGFDYGVGLSSAGLDSFTFWLFYDIGSIGGLDDQRRYYSSVGLGLSIDRAIRFNLARRLDQDDPRLQFSVEF